MTFIQGTHRPVLDGGTGLWNEADTGFLANFQATMADDELRLASNGVENELEKRWNANAVAFKKATGGNLQEQMIFRNMFLEAARGLLHTKLNTQKINLSPLSMICGVLLKSKTSHNGKRQHR